MPKKIPGELAYGYSNFQPRFTLTTKHKRKALVIFR